MTDFKNRSLRGFTLLEVQLAAAILAVVMVVALGFLAEASSTAGLEVNEVMFERDLQISMDQVVIDLKEANPSLVSYYDFQLNDPDSTWQTAVCFPTARQQGTDKFIFTNAGGQIQTQPVWQGVAVYAVYYDAAADRSWLTRYVNYNTSFDYDNFMPTVTGHTDTLITLSNGVTFQRDAQTGMSGNQLIKRLPGEVIQLVRNPAPPANALYPLSLTLMSKKRLRELGGDELIVTSTTSVLARNNN